MPGEQSKIRQILRDQDEHLYSILIRNWQIAQEDWLPAIGPQKDSSNAYPHLRGLEEHLDQALVISEGGKPHLRVQLRPAELYLLLASVLFHDIGRTRVGTKEHWVDSRAMIRRCPGDLGIPRELADALGDICYCHQPPAVAGGGKSADDQLDDLTEIVIEPHGVIRRQAIAVLLALADVLDGAHRRVVPNYLTGMQGQQVIGEFRRQIKGTYVNHDACMIETHVNPIMRVPNPALMEFNLCPEDQLTPEASVLKAELGLARLQTRQATIWRKQLKRALNKSKKKVKKPDDAMLKLSDIDKLWVKNHLRESGEDRWRLDSSLCSRALKRRRFTVSEWLVARGILRVDRSPESHRAWPTNYIIAMLLSNLAENKAALHRIQGHLTALGLPLYDWLLNLDEHLYDALGREAYEPLFPRGYLERAAHHMWELSASVFGGELSYENLAARMGEHSATRATLAVRRLSVFAPRTLWVGEKHWRWAFELRDGEHCRFESKMRLVKRCKDVEVRMDAN